MGSDPPSTSSTPRSPRAPKRRRRAALGLAAGLAALASAVWWAGTGRSPGGLTEKQVRAEAASAAAPPQVTVVRPLRGGLQRKTIQPGTVQAFESVDLYAKVSGFLKAQSVDIGDAVKKGQVLAEIDVPELEKDAEAAAAALTQAKVHADLASAKVLSAQAERDAVGATLPQDEARLDQAEARRALNEKQYERIKGLHAQNAVDRRLVDEQQHEMESSQAGERSARAAIVSTKAELAAAAAKVRQAEAEAAEARAAIQSAEARLARAKVVTGFARVVAPFDGVITRRNFHPGAFIRSASDGTSEPLLTVKRTDLMRVVVQVPDLDVALLDVNDPATVTVDALKGRSFPGRVSRLAKAESPTTRTMRVEIDLPNPKGLLCEGLYGRVLIELEPPSRQLTVPAQCVTALSEGGKAAVFVARGGTARRVPVVVGEDDGTRVELLSGVGPDDEVIVRPGNALEDGAPVAVAPSPSTPPAH